MRNKTRWLILCGLLWALTASAPARTEFPSADERQLADYTIKNRQLVFTVCLAGNKARHRAVSNRLNNSTYYMEGEDFVLEFEGRTVLSSEMDVDKVEPGPDSIRLYMTGREFPVEALLEFRLQGSNHWLEKVVSVRASSGREFLKSVRLIDLRKGTEEPRTFPGPGQPVYKKSRFFAVAYPLSEAEVRGGEVRIGHEVGQWIGREWYRSHAAVVGVAEDNKTAKYFFKYLELTRHRPPRPYLLYNTWYDMPGTVNSQDTVKAVQGIKANLTGPYGVKLDAVVLDDGWDNKQKLWQFDSRKFPQGIAPVRESAAEIGAKPGMWFSPAGGYGAWKNQRLRGTWGQGYEKNFTAGVISGGFCPAGKKYHEAFESRVLESVKSGVTYFKLDNIGSKCGSPSHGHRPGDYSRAAVTDALIEVMDDAHKIDKDVFFNITVGTWLSPFWLQYADCVWMGGMDYSFAGPGSRREQSITYRDRRLYKELRENNYQFPINGMMTHGVIKAKTNFKDPEPIAEFEHDVIVYLGRGISMWELYISPEALSGEEWAVLARWIKWAGDNRQILQDSSMVLGDPNRLEPYGYLHRKDNQAILVLRNPSDKSQAATVNAADLGLNSLEQARQEYPSPRDFRVQNSEFRIDLAPFQVSVFRIQ